MLSTEGRPKKCQKVEEFDKKNIRFRTVLQRIGPDE